MSGVKRFSLFVAVVLGASVSAIAASWASGPDITITPSSPTFLPGDTVTYDVTMTNNDTENLANVIFGFTLEDDAPTIVNNTMPAGPQNIPVGESVSYQTTVQIPADFSPIRLDATAAILGSDGDEIESEDVRINLAAPLLSLTKTANFATFLRGNPVIYTITVRNNGFASAENVTILDTLPAQLTNVVVLPATGCTFNAGPKTISCTPFALAASEIHVVNFAATVSATTPCNSLITNNVAATSDNAPDLSAKAEITATCPTPTPSPTATPTTAPAPSSSGGSSGGGEGGGPSSGGGESAPAQGKVKAAKTVSPSSADKKAKDFIPFKGAPAIVEQIFAQVFGRKITPPESTYWKGRARTDKATISKLERTMRYRKGLEKVQGAKTTTTTGKTAPKKVTVASLFQSVYGRKPTISELSYWRRAAVKKNTVTKLANAMRHDKAQKIKH